MKRELTILAVAGVLLTACTDQPTPVEPEPTATVTETVTAEPTDALATPERVTRMIAQILEQPVAEKIPVGQAALVELERALTFSAEEHDCSITDEALPEVSAYGTVTLEDNDPETTRGLAALGFNTVPEAATFTDSLDTVLAQCQAATYEAAPLTHHTDEAIEIQMQSPKESTGSIVIIRNGNWVLLAVSTPPTDVALSLTQLDQLDEMLR